MRCASCRGCIECPLRTATVPAYTALGRRKQIAEHWEEREYTIWLEGRARGFSRLTTAWDTAKTGVGQLVSVVGDAGVGKSRLIAEKVTAVRLGCMYTRSRVFPAPPTEEG